MQNPGKVFSKINIYESIWEEEYLGDDNAVKTHMSNLRNKLKTPIHVKNMLKQFGVGLSTI
ncbi:helix-turn-helix domain-containing protein [Bacillus velezensis]|uniref:winged helix-turn-helix domain-containing protein n=1 Tax=Bacillus velezensis TaxID=492670 RepID=UPI001E5842DE|nr:helix-turn-helix domain-containing protein [Bacillus velezensis]